MLHVVPHSVPTRRSSGLRTLHRLAQIGAVLVAQGLGGEAITIQRIATDHTLHILPVARAIVEAEIAVGAAHHDRATVGATDEDFALRSEEHTSELQYLMRTSYAVFCLKNKK